jgi:hypothetical protein
MHWAIVRGYAVTVGDAFVARFRVGSPLVTPPAGGLNGAATAPHAEEDASGARRRVAATQEELPAYFGSFTGPADLGPRFEEDPAGRVPLG